MDYYMQAVLITGASRGLGLALVQKFHAHKYKVYAVVRSISAYQRITEMYPDVSVLVADITDVDYEKSLENFLCNTTVDIIINNAGSAGTTGTNTINSTSEQLTYEFRTHCIGALSTVKAVLESMKPLSPSLVINISSRRGSLSMQAAGATKAVVCSFSYRIAKAAQNMLSLCMADDLENMGVKVVSIHPGAMLTKMAPADASLSPEQSASRLLKMIESGKLSSREFICLETGMLQW
jgi:NAD(P)-dependent dehydrogenase (short-subunit alcohol dehydrogenase family)